MIFSPDLKLGVHFDTHNINAVGDDVLYTGDFKLLEFLEKQHGIYTPRRRDDHLRIEYYRLLLNDYSNKNNCFYSESFNADALASAEHLLCKRDELILSGLDFSQITETAPDRIRVFAGVETENLENKNHLAQFKQTEGFADRFMTVLKAYQKSSFKFKSISLLEPFEILPVHLQLFLKISEKKTESEKVRIESAFETKFESSQFSSDTAILSHLEKFKNFLNGELNQEAVKTVSSTDNSILILEAPNESDAAIFLSHLIKYNAGFNPFFLVKDSHRVLDESLYLNGLPTMGLASSSEVRPSLQILKLVTAFLWKPFETDKVLQFVSLKQKPLNFELGRVIAKILNEKPGIGSEMWKQDIAIFFSNYEAISEDDEERENIESVRKAFNFWFNRIRYDINSEAPLKEVAAIFEYVQKWSNEQFLKSKGKNVAMRVLTEQSRRIFEYFEALITTGQRAINKQNIERVIRVIVEATPFQPTVNTVHSSSYTYHESLIPTDTNTLVWWNFTDSEIAIEPLFWEESEINYLAQIGISIDTPKKNQSRQLLYQKIPFLNTTQKIILVVPRVVTGVEVKEHPLLSYLKVCFSDISGFYVHHQNYSLEASSLAAGLKNLFNFPKKEILSPYSLQAVPTHLELGFDAYEDRTHENISTIDALLFYPHQWFLGSVLNLRRSNLVSTISENILRGRTAHRFFELILNSDFYEWRKNDLENWFDENALQILEHEGVLLLQYGEETNLKYFIDRVKRSIWTLMNYIKQDGWRVLATEKKLEAKLNDLNLHGISDLVLQRGTEICIVDLKWSGITAKKNLITNREDFQLILYGHAYAAENISKIHGAYFIIESAKLLVRNNEAFSKINALDKNAGSNEIMQHILNKIDATYKWRFAQFESGLIEIRTTETIGFLEEYYNNMPENILEMRNKAHNYDNFSLLVKNVI